MDASSASTLLTTTAKRSALDRIWDADNRIPAASGRPTIIGIPFLTVDVLRSVRDPVLLATLKHRLRAANQPWQAAEQFIAQGVGARRPQLPRDTVVRHVVLLGEPQLAVDTGRPCEAAAVQRVSDSPGRGHLNERGHVAGPFDNIVDGDCSGRTGRRSDAATAVVDARQTAEESDQVTGREVTALTRAVLIHPDSNGPVGSDAEPCDPDAGRA